MERERRETKRRRKRRGEREMWRYGRGIFKSSGGHHVTPLIIFLQQQFCVCNLDRDLHVFISVY
jgi:hypothetical protein